MYFKKFSRCAGNLFIVILSTQRNSGGDLVQNRCFTEVKLVNVCTFSIMKSQLSEKIFRCAGNLFIVILSTWGPLRGDGGRGGGAIQLKNAIFKEEIRVCYGTKIFNKFLIND